jgi:hypothetical protein
MRILLICRAAEYEADAIGIRLLAKACDKAGANNWPRPPKGTAFALVVVMIINSRCLRE